MHAHRLLKSLQPCIQALPQDPTKDTRGQAWLRQTAALLQSDKVMEEDQVQDILNEGLWAVRNTPDMVFPKAEKSYIGPVPTEDGECEILSVDSIDSMRAAALLAAGEE